MNKALLSKENRLNRANSAEFALSLFEINQPSGTSIAPEGFRQVISEDAFAINSFLEYETDTSDRMRAVDIALRITEVYNRSFPQTTRRITTDELFTLAGKILEFMRYAATPIA
jgi:hypothetical protein